MRTLLACSTLPPTVSRLTGSDTVLLVRLGLQARTPQEDVPRLQPLRLLLRGHVGRLGVKGRRHADDDVPLLLKQFANNNADFRVE
jgi:hypothetical protein